MGMYTGLHLTLEIKDNPEVLALLRYMTGDDLDGYSAADLPDHVLFKTARWEYMLRCVSAYHEYSRSGSKLGGGFGGHYYVLTVNCSLNNYDNEIAKFLDWIAAWVTPLSDDQQFVGYTQYELAEHPTLIYYNPETHCLDLKAPWKVVQDEG